MFCGFKPELQNLSAPENIEEIKQKWNKDVLTYCIMNLTPKLTEETINQQIDSAFKVWKRNSALKFKKVKPNETIDIKISFCQREHGDGFPFKGNGWCVSLMGFILQEVTSTLMQKKIGLTKKLLLDIICLL